MEPGPRDFQLADPRLVLVAAGDLSADGIDAGAAAELAARSGLAREALEILGTGFARYLERGRMLARRAPPWPAPRRRHVGVVVGDPASVAPHAQILNTNAWLLWKEDLGPGSDPELVAWLLAVGDWKTLTGELSMAAVRAGAWWIDRDEGACRAFARAARESTRPDADGLRAVAEAIPWLRELGHQALRPDDDPAARSIPGTGLQVPPHLEAEPPRLVNRCADTARSALARHRAAWRAPADRGIERLAGWLAEVRPPLLVAAGEGDFIWDPEAPDELRSLRTALADADAVAVTEIHADLRVVAAKSERLRPRLAGRTSASDASGLERGGYAWLDTRRELLVYDLDEPGMERRRGPALPYARAMLGARCAHEWGHQADCLGRVPCVLEPPELERRKEHLGAAFADVLERCPAAVREAEAADLAELCDRQPPGAALAELLLTRLPDYRANLVARRFTSDLEAETYVQHNVRCLRAEHPPGRRLRLLVRYVYEAQYLSAHLGMTGVGDPLDLLLALTGVEDDLLATGLLSLADLCALIERTAEVCAAFEVDAAWLDDLQGVRAE